MKYFIMIPTSLSLNETPEDRYNTRMEAIHKLASEGFSSGYTIFDTNWWSDSSLEERGVKNSKLHLFSKCVEELSKCDGLCLLHHYEGCDEYNMIKVIADTYNMKTIVL